MAGKLSVLSPAFGRGKDGWSAPGPTAGKFSVLSAGPPPPVLTPRGLLGWLAAAGPPLHVLPPRGLLGWPAAGTPWACVALAPAGGTARNESVISQGGTPVFGRAPPASGSAAPGLAAGGGAAPAAG
jgi:hypothetical protein